MSDRRVVKRILVIANEAAEEQTLHEVIRSCSQGADAEVLVIAAESRLDACLEPLHGAGIRAHGRVGDADPLQAVSDGLDGFAADEIVLATRTGKRPHWSSRKLVERVRKRFAGPIFHVVADPVPRPRLRRRLGGADHQDVRASPVRPSASTGRAASDIAKRPLRRPARPVPLIPQLSERR